MEFCAMILDVKSKDVIAEFHRYVKPSKISNFRMDELKIMGHVSETKIQSASGLRSVLADFHQFMKENVTNNLLVRN